MTPAYPLRGRTGTSIVTSSAVDRLQDAEMSANGLLPLIDALSSSYFNPKVQKSCGAVVNQVSFHFQYLALRRDTHVEINMDGPSLHSGAGAVIAKGLINIISMYIFDEVDE